MTRFLKQAVLSLREAAVLSAIDAGGSLALQVLLQVPFVDSYGLILLIESAVLMLVGGAMSFAGQGGVRYVVDVFSRRATGKKISPGKDELEKSELRAALYAITGFLLFSEAIVLTAVLS